MLLKNSAHTVDANLQKHIQPHGPAAGGQAQSGEAAVEDCQGVRDARMPAGHLRRQRQPHGGGGRCQGIVFVDDAFAAGTDEGPRRTVPTALVGHPRLLFDHRCANVILEGLNGIIRHVKTRSRGFRNMDCFSTMIYLTCGKLGLNTVTA